MHTYKKQERWLSGRKRTTRNRLIGNYSWVRIPPSPLKIVSRNPKNKIKSVSDIGCGDWEFSQYINWDDLTYKGYDIVESVIQSNNKKFAKPNIEFKLLKDYNKISHSDLLICKDVLQHLNHKEVNKFIEIVFPKFKKILLTNDVSNNSLNDDSRYNKDLKPGEYAWFDIRKGPYLLKAKTLLKYNVHYGKDGNYWKKETVLVNLNN